MPPTGRSLPHSTQTVLIGLDRADDKTIWNAARAGDFTLVTLDSDFAEMAVVLGPPPKVIWLRCGNQPTSYVARLLRRNADIIALFHIDPALSCLEIY